MEGFNASASIETSHELTQSPALITAVLTTSSREDTEGRKCHFSPTLKKRMVSPEHRGKREIYFRSPGDGVCRELGCREGDYLGSKIKL